MGKPSYIEFDKTDFNCRPDVDYSAQPEAYRSGREAGRPDLRALRIRARPALAI